jgi:hypothetical protein
MWPTAHKIKSKLGKVWSCVIMDRFGVCGGKDMTTGHFMEYFLHMCERNKGFYLTGDHFLTFFIMKISFRAVQ